MAEGAPPQDGEYTSDPMDVSGFAAADLVFDADVLRAGAGQGLAVVFQDSDDEVTWCEAASSTVSSDADGVSRHINSVELSRQWLRLRFRVRPPGAGQVFIRANLRLRKRNP